MAHRNVHPQRINDSSSPQNSLAHAQEARNLLERGEGFGMLSTLHSDTKSPFGSVVNYALNEKGQILFFASKLAEHFENIVSDPRVSLLVVDETKSASSKDRLALSRVTIMGEAVVLSKSEEDSEVLYKRHPASAKYGKWEDFVIIGITKIDHVRYIKGFGEMSWITGDEFAKTSLDVVSISSKYAVDHMNSDHGNHLLMMARAFSPQHKDDLENALVLRFDRLGFDLLCKSKTVEGYMIPIRISFDHELKSADELRPAVMDLTKRAETLLNEQQGNETKSAQ